MKRGVLISVFVKIGQKCTRELSQYALEVRIQELWPFLERFKLFSGYTVSSETIFKCNYSKTAYKRCQFCRLR